MAFLASMVVVFFAVFSISCRGDIVSDAEEKVKVVDAAIIAAENAWIKASAQVQILKIFVDNANPKLPEVQAAQQSLDDFQRKIIEYETILDDLQARRAEFHWNVDYFKKVRDANQLAVVAGKKISDYKTSYLAQISGMSTQLGVVESAIAAIQAIVAETALTDAKNVAASDARGRALGALTGLENSLGSVADISGKINADMETIRQMSPALGAQFNAWWAEQAALVTQQRNSIPTRKQMLEDLNNQMIQKKKAFDDALAQQQQLDAAQKDLQAKKVAAMALLNNLVEIRAALIQQISDLANTIASTLGSVDQTLGALTGDVALAGALSQAQSASNNMLDMGDLQRAFSNSQDMIASAIDSMKEFFSDQELLALQGSIAKQVSWMNGFASAVEALRNQAGSVRTKLDAKRTELAASTAAAAKQTAAEYASSVQQFLQVITQVHNEAKGLVSDIMMPLVLGVSQKVMTLTNYVSAQPSTASALAEMKNFVDQAKADSGEIQSLIAEFNLWSKTFDEYEALSNTQITDASVKAAIVGFKKDFTSWKIWIAAVVSRQEVVVKTIGDVEGRYNTYSAQVKALSDASSSLEISTKQLATSLAALDQSLANVQTAYQEAQQGLAALTSLSLADGVLDKITALIALVVPLEVDMAKAQAVFADISKTFEVSKSSKLISDTYSQPVAALKERFDALAQKVTKVRADTNALKDQAVAKKASFVSDKAAADKAAADKIVADKLAADQLLAAKSAEEKAAVEKAQAEKAAADKAIADKTAADATAAQNLSAMVTTSGAANVKALTDSVAGIKATQAGFAAKFGAVKTTDDLAAATKDFNDAKSSITQLEGSITKLIADADAAQKTMDTDKAAGRNISNDVVAALAAQRSAIAAAQTDLAAATEALKADQVLFDRLAADFAKKNEALSGVNTALADFSSKTQSIGVHLDRIKTSLAAGQKVMTDGVSADDFDAALATLTDVEKLKITIANAKASDADPAQEKVKAAVAEYNKSFGELPASVATSVGNQTTWLGALDGAVATSMDSIAALKVQLTAKRDQLAQDDAKALETMTFAAQIDKIFKLVPLASQPAQIESVMRRLDYAVSRRYGNQDDDKAPGKIVENKTNLIKLVDWIMKNKRFGTKISKLSEYAKTIRN